MGKDSWQRGGQVFTASEKGYPVKCDIVLPDWRQAQALKQIIRGFETSALKRGNNGKDLG